MGCVLPVMGTDGITDGPVLRGRAGFRGDLSLGRHRTIPFDAFGAPGWDRGPGGAGGPAAPGVMGPRAVRRRRFGGPKGAAPPDGRAPHVP